MFEFQWRKVGHLAYLILQADNAQPALGRAGQSYDFLLRPPAKVLADDRFHPRESRDDRSTNARHIRKIPCRVLVMIQLVTRTASPRLPGVASHRWRIAKNNLGHER